MSRPRPLNTLAGPRSMLPPCTRLALLLLAWLVAPFPAAAAEAPERIVRAGRVETLAGPPLTPGEVLITGGKIKAVAERIDAPESVEHIDLGPNAVLMPGLVDANAPVDLVGARSEFTRELTPGYRVLPAIDWQGPALRRLLASGVTTAAVLPGTDNVVGGLACIVKTAGPPSERVVLPEAALVVAVCSDPAARNLSRVRPDSIYVRSPTNRMGVVNMLRAAFDAARDPQREFGPPLDGQVPVPLPLLREAMAGHRRVFGHSRTDFDIRTLLGLGEEFGFAPLVVGGQEAYRVGGLLAERKTPVILAPLNITGRIGEEGTELSWNLPGLLDEAGVAFALSGGDLLDQARFARRYGLNATQALAAITTTPARLLGLADRLGSIEPGKDADLIALEGDPLEFTTPIRWVMVAGAIAAPETPTPLEETAP